MNRIKLHLKHEEIDANKHCCELCSAGLSCSAAKRPRLDKASKLAKPQPRRKAVKVLQIPTPKVLLLSIVARKVSICLSQSPKIRLTQLLSRSFASRYEPSLHLGRLTLKLPKLSLADDLVSWVLPQLSRLRSLRLGGSLDVGPLTEVLASRLPRLRHLSLAVGTLRGYRTAEQVAPTLARGCLSRIQSLGLGVELPSGAFVALLDLAPDRLRKLVAKRTDGNRTPVSVEALTRALRRMPRLEKLVVSARLYHTVAYRRSVLGEPWLKPDYSAVRLISEACGDALRSLTGLAIHTLYGEGLAGVMPALVPGAGVFRGQPRPFASLQSLHAALAVDYGPAEAQLAPLTQLRGLRHLSVELANFRDDASVEVISVDEWLSSWTSLADLPLRRLEVELCGALREGPMLCAPASLEALVVELCGALREGPMLCAPASLEALVVELWLPGERRATSLRALSQDALSPRLPPDKDFPHLRTVSVGGRTGLLDGILESATESFPNLDVVRWDVSVAAGRRRTIDVEGCLVGEEIWRWKGFPEYWKAKGEDLKM